MDQQHQTGRNPDQDAGPPGNGLDGPGLEERDFDAVPRTDAEIAERSTEATAEAESQEDDHPGDRS
jgi:hypothetical protein